MPTPKPRPNPERDRRRRDFLRALAAGRSVAAAAEGASIAWSTLYAWRRDVPRFRAAWDRAAEFGAEALGDRVQSALIERAIDGVDEPVFHAGKFVGTRKRYSDALLLAMMREQMIWSPAEPAAAATADRPTAVIHQFDAPDEDGKPASVRPAAPEPVTPPASLAAPAAPPRPLSRWGDDGDPATDQRW